MNYLRRSRGVKVMAVFMTINLISQIIVPNVAWALTSGPTQPEFSSFEPVTTTNMVDPFTGSFTYNLPVMEVPGPNGGGYAVSMSYHSGVTTEQEASWVGLGWTLNPGAINRHKRGFADDIKGGEITHYRKTKASHTISAGKQVGGEAFSFNGTASFGGSYNNYRGISKDWSVSLAVVNGLANCGFSGSSNSGTRFNAGLNLGTIFERIKQKREKRKAEKGNSEQESDQPVDPSKALQTANNKRALNSLKGALISASQSFGISTVIGGNGSLPTVGSEQELGFNYNLTYTNQVSPTTQNVGPETGFFGRYTYSKQKDSFKSLYYGSMYNGAATLDPYAEMDYYTEKDNSYTQRDKYLPASFANTDLFNVSGEGVRGGFRLNRIETGHFRSRYVKNETTMSDLSYETAVGLDNEPAGFGVAYGTTDNIVGNWGHGNGDLFDYKPNLDQKVIFKFDGDLGGSEQYSTSDDPYKATVVKTVDELTSSISIKTKKPFIDSKGMNLGNTNGWSSSAYIGYNTHSDLNETITTKNGESVRYRAYDKTSKEGLFDGNQNDTVFQNSLGEFSIVNENGQQYAYGLPVYASNEKNMAYGVKGYLPESTDPSLVKRDISNIDNISTVQGDVFKGAYANNFLLTSITNADYIDRTFDGPSRDDFGGWTKFEYKRAYGSDKKDGDKSDWYHWRRPYVGLSYSRGDRPDRDDDMGNLSSGYKEVYYLKSIETKTHKAFFITNRTDVEVPAENGSTVRLRSSVSGPNPRIDGIEAANDNSAATNLNAHGDAELEKLERIELYALNDRGEIVGKPIKVAHMDYDYSLCPGVSNNLLGTGENTGKLTLKKVWFEYQGIKNARIRPYEFKYDYRDFVQDQNLKARYTAAISHGLNTNGEPKVEGNPAYSHSAIDPWGNYRINGDLNTFKEAEWIDQSLEPNVDYDPAPWTLKEIKLPSGGQILVQYEGNDYSYVQDEKPAVMMRLKRSSAANIYFSDQTGDFQFEDRESSWHYLDTGVLGGDVNTSNMEDYANFLRKYLLGRSTKFKFLFSLKDDGGRDLPTLNRCNNAFVSGYSQVADVRVDEHGIKVKLVGHLPRNIAIEKVRAQWGGIVPKINCYDSSNDDRIKERIPESGVVGKIKKFVDVVKEAPGFNESSYCRTINLDHSYIKVPVWRKKGSGARVKRLLMHDNGIEDGLETLYGTEYVYKTLDGSSSGVALNEPTGARDENPLIHHMNKREAQNIIQDVFNGADTEQFEGPFGESVLPPASVGYSGVLIKNIYGGKTSPGFTFKEFYTAKDFPVQFKHTKIHKEGHPFPIPILSPIHYESKYHRWATQGYAIILNDMHGKPKRSSTYTGAFNGILSTENTLSSRTTYAYTRPGEKVKVMTEDGQYEDRVIGRDEEVAMEGKRATSYTDKTSTEMDPEIGGVGLVQMPNFSASVVFTFVDHKIYRHVTTKVIRYSTLTKAILVEQDGVKNRTDNLVYDAQNGQPIVTASTDGYNGLTILNNPNHHGRYLNYSIPASKIYKHMGRKSQNERFVMEGEFKLYDDCLGTRGEWLGSDPVCHAKRSFLSIQDGANVDQGPTAHFFRSDENTPFVNESRGSIVAAIDAGRLIEGDLVELSVVEEGVNRKALFYINEIDAVYRHRLYLNPLSIEYNEWLEGTGFPRFTRLEVIRSGYTNQLTVPAASVATYGQDLQQVVASNTDGSASLLGNVNGVVSASATMFSDDWYNYALTKEYDDVEYHCLKAKNFETGARGKWRPKSSYVYKTSISEANGNGKTYNAGIYDILKEFDFLSSKLSVYEDAAYRDNSHGDVNVNWGSPVSSTGEFTNYPVNDEWTRTSTISMYSPNGEVLEERNVLDVPSCAKFGYGENVPTLVAQNAPYYAVYFNGFDDDTRDFVSDVAAHSGKYSAKLTKGNNLEFGEVEAVKNVEGQYVIKAKCWVHASEVDFANIKNQLKVELVKLEDATLVPTKVKQVSRVGEWVLLEAIADDGLEASNTIDPAVPGSRGPGTYYALRLTNNGNDVMYIDDVRIQPAESQMTTYVYDRKNLRLLASFDDQHFGLFYQYNAEGKLTRKLIETERGVKTVTETQYHTPGVARTE